MGQSLAIPRVIPNDWKRLDLIVNKIKMRLGRDSSPTFAGLTLFGITQGSVLFAGAGGVISQDNDKLFWDATNLRLGVGTATPNLPLHVESALNNVAKFVSTDNRASIQVSDNDTNTYLGAEAGISWIGHGPAKAATNLNILVNGNVGIGETVPETLTEWTHVQPYLTLHNSTPEDTDGGRESRLIFKGEQSGGEETTLARIQVSHDGSSDDQLGKIVLSVNTGAGLAQALEIDSDLLATFAGAVNTTSIELGHASDTTITRVSTGVIAVEGTTVMLVGGAPTAHTIASHSDTTGTGAELNTLTDGSDAGALHSHAAAYQPLDAELTSLAALSYVSASFVKMTGANTFALRTLQQTSDDLEATIDHDNLLNFAANEHYLQSAITTVGTIATGVWQATDVGIAYGGTGQSTAQLAINALSAVSGATNEHVLTKDTATGNAIFKVAAGGAHTHDGDTLQLDGVNSDGGAFAFTTSDAVTFSQDLILSGTETYGIDLSSGTWSSAALNLDAIPKIFANGTQVIKIDDTNFNIFLGSSAFNGNEGINNVGIGYQVGFYNDVTGSGNEGDGNTYIGYWSGFGVTGNSNKGYNNVGLGNQTLYSNSTGYDNIAAGANAMFYNTTGRRNAAFGSAALNNCLGGGNNLAMGYAALGYEQGGDLNTAIGSQAMKNTRGADENTVIGGLAGRGNTASSNYNYNTIIGTRSAYLLTTGSSNIFIGYYSGYRQTTNSNLLIVDNQQRADVATELTNAILYGIMAAAPANQTLRINAGVIMMDDIPVADPTNAGQLWNDNGILTVSAG